MHYKLNNHWIKCINVYSVNHPIYRTSIYAGLHEHRPDVQIHGLRPILFSYSNENQYTSIPYSRSWHQHQYVIHDTISEPDEDTPNHELEVSALDDDSWLYEYCIIETTNVPNK